MLTPEMFEFVLPTIINMIEPWVILGIAISIVGILIANKLRELKHKFFKG